MPNDVSQQIHRCFMTGRTCIHEQEIHKCRQEMQAAHSDRQQRAFVLMPFSPDLDAIYNWQIKPFIEREGVGDGSHQKWDVQRADEVWQVGFIICTKICKQIQMADLVVADISFDNPNVFYEFGISAALRKQILLVGMGRICSDKDRGRIKFFHRHFGLALKDPSAPIPETEKIIQYPEFGYMTGSVRQSLYDTSELPKGCVGDKVLILYESSHGIRIPNKHAEGDPPGLPYDFGSLCRTAASTAVRSIFYPEPNDSGERRPGESPKPDTLDRYRDKVAGNLQHLATKGDGGKGQVYDERSFIRDLVVLKDLAKESFEDIAKAVGEAGCVIVDIRYQDPRAFFWLGFLHATSAHVIPVSVSQGGSREGLRKEEPQKEAPARPQRTMAFDIVGLWHAEVDPDSPLKFQNALRDMLQYFYAEKAKQLQKDAFWLKLLGVGPHSHSVSVFLGTIREEKLGRNSLGDWDYRSAAEITGFLAQAPYTVKLESPIIKPSEPDRVRGDPRVKYLDRLKGAIRDKNCVVIGSADINELTELVWSTIHGFTPFEAIEESSAATKKGNPIDCFIATKEVYGMTEEDKKRLYGYGRTGMASFILRDAQTNEGQARGFVYRNGIAVQKIVEPFKGPHHTGQSGGKVQTLYGQLIVCRNPWSTRGDNWIVMINGTSGPATLGIAQMLTGCLFTEFTINALDPAERARVLLERAGDARRLGDFRTISPDNVLPYNDRSEVLLTKCLQLLDNGSAGFEAIVAVDVYYPPEETLNDERKVVGWDFLKILNTTTSTSVDNPRPRKWEPPPPPV